MVALADGKEQLMSILEKIAHLQGRRDEVPNQELAESLARSKSRPDIQEIADNLDNRDPHIQADCLKVLYEIGYRDPSLISRYSDAFVELLTSKNNRLVWGAMIALSTIVELESGAIGAHVKRIMEIMRNGSVITVDNGVRVLAVIASKEPKLRKELTGFLFEHLRTCRAKDLPQHSEKIRVAVGSSSKAEFLRILNARAAQLNTSQLKRVKKVMDLVKTV